MPITVSKFSNDIRSPGITQGTLAEQLERNGRLPSIQLGIYPLEGGQFIMDRFLHYKFSSSILKPCDQFSFTFAVPDDPFGFDRYVTEGDIVQLSANNVALSTGIIDQTELETDMNLGEKATINGRDLMSQYEDQDAISFVNKPIWGNAVSVEQAIRLLNESTRIPNEIILQDAPTRGDLLLATEPGEKKLSALQRFLEPLNCIAWMRGDGKIVVGKPNMAQAPKGTLILSKERRESNVTSMKVTRSSTHISNIVVPVWSGQEFVTERLPQQAMNNASGGPDRLRRLGHLVPKTVVVSTPQGSSPQDLASANAIKQTGTTNLLQAYAKREIARQNIQEKIVQVIAPGHYDENGEPFVVDSVYNIQYDRGNVSEKMYLYECDYEGGEEGQHTILHFCKLGCIVADVRAP
jgi:prophage tail gpP-like protein